MAKSIVGSFIGFLLGALVLAACGSDAPTSGDVEARLAAVEATLAQLCMHFTTEPSGKLTISAPDICITSAGDIDITAVDRTDIRAGVVALNDGTRPASGVGDGVAGGFVSSGAPSVLLP